MITVAFNQNELEALRIRWENGELKPAEIQDRFSWPIENATLRSVLMNLVEKKQATRQQRGKAFFYAARVPKAALLENFMHQLARIFAGGSEKELVAQLVETADIKPADLAQLRHLATETPKEVRSKTDLARTSKQKKGKDE